MYLFSDSTYKLHVKDALVIVDLYYDKWPNSKVPGIFCSTWITSKPKITNSFGISDEIAVLDGAGTPTDGVLFATIQEWLAAGKYAGFGGIWDIGMEDIFFGGEQVYAWENEQ